MSLSDPEDPPPNERPERDTIPAPVYEHVEAVAIRVVELLRPALKEISQRIDALDTGVGLLLRGQEHLDEALRAQGMSLAENVVQTSQCRIACNSVADGLIALDATVREYHQHNVSQASLTGRRLSMLDELLTKQGAKVEDLDAWRRRHDGEDNGSIADAVSAERGGE